MKLYYAYDVYYHIIEEKDLLMLFKPPQLKTHKSASDFPSLETEGRECTPLEDAYYDLTYQFRNYRPQYNRFPY